MFCIHTKKDSRIFYQCPRCSTRTMYFTVPQERSMYCDRLIPSPEKLMKSIEARLNYHKFSAD